MTREKKQMSLFDSPEWWEEHWQGMPEFIQDDEMPFKQIIINFKNMDDYIKFQSLISQKLTLKTQSVWFPKENTPWYSKKAYKNES